MSTVAKALATLFGIILISAVACGSDQSPSAIVSEPEPTATPTAKATEPEVADDLSDQATEMDKDTTDDLSEQAMEMDKDTDDDRSEQAMEADKDTDDDRSEQATEMDKDAAEDHSEQATEMDKDAAEDHSEQAMEMDKDAAEDHSEQAMETVEDTADDHSDQAMETVEDTDDDRSDQAMETVEDTADDHSEQAMETVEDTTDDHSDQAMETGEDTADDHSDQAMETVEEPEPSDNETLKVGRDVGEKVLDFSITLEGGTVRTTQDLLSEGRPVYIYFFATWCPVCRRDLAELQAIYPEYAEAVEFIVVGQDPTEPLSDLIAYRDDQGQSWTMAVAGPRMLADLRITTQAFKLAFDSGGVITYRAGFGNGDPDVWRGVIADLAGG